MVEVHSYGPCPQSTLPPIPNNILPDKTFSVAAGAKNQQMQSNTALSTVNIPKIQAIVFVNRYKINPGNKQGSRVQNSASTPNTKRRSNSTRKHCTRPPGKRETRLWLETAHGRWKLCHSPSIISPLKTFSGGGGTN